MPVVVVHDRLMEARDLNERLGEIAGCGEVLVRRDHARPAGAEGAVLIPDRTGVHDLPGVLVEIERGIEAVHIRAEFLDQIHLDQGFQIHVLVIILPGIGVLAGIVAVGVLRIDGVFKFLIVLTDVADRVRAREFGALEIHAHALRGQEAVGLVILRVVQLDQIAARQVRRVLQTLGVAEFLTEAVLTFQDHRIVPVARVEILIRRFEIRDIDGGAADAVLLAEEIDAAVLSVVVEIHPVVARHIRHAQRGRDVLQGLVMQLRGVRVPRQQHPGLALSGNADEVRLAVQFDLICFLGRVREGRVPARLDLRERAVIHCLAVLPEEQHGALGLVVLAGVDVAAALGLRVRAVQEQRRDGRLHDVDRKLRKSVDRDADHIAVRALLIRDRRHIDRVFRPGERHAAPVPGQGDRIRRAGKRERHGKLL